MCQYRKRRVRGLKVRLFKRQRGLCYYCAKPVLLGEGPANGRVKPRFATIDHIIPKSAGGALKDNAVVACAACNNERGDRDARLFLLEKTGALA